MRTGTVFVVVALVVLPACARETTTPSAVADQSELPADQIVYGLRHNMTSEGIRKAVLLSDTAYVREDGRRFDLVDVDLDFFDENGKPSGDLTSKTGEYQINTGSFVARGNVVLITQGPKGPRRLESEELHYDPSNNQIWSNKPFVLHEGGQVSRGASFRSDTEFKNFTIQGAQGSIPSGQITF
jgi:LPS export ABC transporter protein LptC